MQDKTSKRKKRNKRQCMQSRCAVCGDHTTYICKWCKAVGATKGTAICNANNGKDCLLKHFQKSHEI